MSGPSAPRQVLDDIGLSLVFFTRLRLPSSDFGGRSLADAIWAAPFAGLAVAIIGALVYAIATVFGLLPDAFSASFINVGRPSSD